MAAAQGQEPDRHQLTPLGIEGLPGPNEAYRRHLAALDGLDWTDRPRLADFLIRDARAVAGTRHPHDVAAVQRLVEADLARSPAFASLRNHLALTVPSPAEARAADIRLPTLILHGTADPVFPIAHAEAMAAAIKDATLIRIEGGGHELHPADWPEIVQAILNHTRHHTRLVHVKGL